VKARIAFLPGDGIGPEVLSEARAVLKTIGKIGRIRFEIVEADIGGIAIEKHGTPLPERTREICLEASAVLLGAVGDPRYQNIAAELRPERGLLELRQLLGNYANLRPIFVFDALVGASPIQSAIVRNVDIMFVRELLGGIYFGVPRSLKKDKAVNSEVYTAEEIRRVARTAFSLARNRRKKVTSVDKANVLETSQLWRATVQELAAEFPDVALEHIYVDSFAMQVLVRPAEFDVVLTTNLFGDILSDEASVLSGSLGMLPSAAIGGPIALYEPVHGSAPEIAGMGKANPIGAISSVAMLLDHSFQLGHLASLVHRAIARVLEKGYRTFDVRSYEVNPSKTLRLTSTREMGELICNAIESPDAV
jgi:3-isopropylmalate dehydrogenase